jgi:hypothetical protein
LMSVAAQAYGKNWSWFLFSFGVTSKGRSRKIKIKTPLKFLVNFSQIHTKSVKNHCKRLRTIHSESQYRIFVPILSFNFPYYFTSLFYNTNGPNARWLQSKLY